MRQHPLPLSLLLMGVALPDLMNLLMQPQYVRLPDIQPPFPVLTSQLLS